MTSLAIVEDHEVIAVGVASALVQRGHTVSIVPAGEPAEMLDRLIRAAPQLVVLDLDLGAGRNGAALVGPLVKHRCRVVVLTGGTGPVRHAACVAAGVEGVITKDQPFARIIDLLDRSAQGAPLISETARQADLRLLREHLAVERARLAPFERLTRAERDILVGLMRGRSTEELAEQRCVTHETVRSQVRTLREKLGVRSQLAAVSQAWRSGWPTTNAPDATLTHPCDDAPGLPETG